MVYNVCTEQLAQHQMLWLAKELHELHELLTGSYRPLLLTSHYVDKQKLELERCQDLVKSARAAHTHTHAQSNSRRERYIYVKKALQICTSLEIECKTNLCSLSVRFLCVAK